MYLNDEQEKWVLDYLASGEGMIPYQMITEFSSLEIKPKDDFFEKKDFYSSLKEKDISAEEYENVKKFFKLLRLKTLGETKFTIFKIPLSYVKFSSKELACLKKFLNTILENATVLARFLDMFKEIRANVL